MDLKNEMLKIKELAEKCNGIEYDNCFEEDVKVLDNTIDNILLIANKALANDEKGASNCNLDIVSGSLPSRELEKQVLADYLDWCRNKYSGIETINDEMISEFVNGQ